MGGGSGTGRITDLSFPLEAIKQRAAQDGSLVQYVLNNTFIISAGSLAPTYPTPPDVCLVFLKTWATEGYDRTTLLTDWNGTALVETVAANCPNTVVITNSGGINTFPFADNPNVTAILAAHFGGEQTGNSIVDVLYGDVNPSGHLPYTVALEEADYEFADITNSTELYYTTNVTAWQSDFKERLLIDYRHFDYYNLSVQYEFGFGLSYTTFELSSLSVAATGGAVSATPPANPVQPGGNPALWETLYTITASVSNTGSIPGYATPQLYLGLQQAFGADPVPVKVLRGFEKVLLQPGESQQVSFPIMRRDLSYWSTQQQEWIISEGDVAIYAGYSSRDIRATSSFNPISGATGGQSGGNGSHYNNHNGGWGNHHGGYGPPGK